MVGIKICKFFLIYCKKFHRPLAVIAWELVVDGETVCVLFHCISLYQLEV
jgi:hypothetical protein